MNFPTSLEAILERVDRIDPVAYERSRNYLDGAVTGLSPYLSRGVLSTRVIFKRLLDKGWRWKQMEKLVQELAWRDYWQLTWKARGEGINQDLRQEQPNQKFTGMPKAVVDGTTGIRAIDAGIEGLYATGYLHNHLRMYTAALCTSIGRYHWHTPAQWMYYHLLDADWASNALSWQWVCGANSKKIYVANQENINRYSRSEQRGSFLDKTYEALLCMDVPEVLLESSALPLTTTLPRQEPINIDPDKPTLVYNLYNLDPFWRQEEDANRVLLLEPDHFRNYPVHERTIAFAIALAQNIPGMQVLTGSFAEVEAAAQGSPIYFKEHPFSRHYRGVEEPREWLAFSSGDHPSFFNYWKKAEKHLLKSGIEYAP